MNKLLLLLFSILPLFTSAVELSEVAEAIFESPIEPDEGDDSPLFPDDNLPVVGINIPEKQTQSVPNALVDFDGEPSAVVGGCVNVVSGNYVENCTDIEIYGHEKLSFERSYASGSPIRDVPFSNWYHNHEGRVVISKKKKEHHAWETNRGYRYFGDWEGPGGLSLRFTASGRVQHDILLSLEHDERKKGLTNLGRVSGKTNIKNLQLLYTKRTSHTHCFLKNGEGGISTFQRRPSDSSFQMLQQAKIDGNRIDYTYNKLDFLTSIKFRHKNSNKANGLKFEYSNDKNVKLTAQDGRELKYEFDKHKIEDKYYYTLKRFTSPDGYFQEFEYNKGEDIGAFRLIRRRNPHGRTLAISYYEPGKNSHNGIHPNVEINSSSDKRLGRVSKIKAPVGFDTNEFTTHRFFYSLHAYTGTADVFDAHNFKTTYDWNKHKQLNSITKYDQNEKPYTYETIEWDDNHKHCGNIHSRTLEDKNHYPILHKRYGYDDYGNVTHESIYGNLTGRDVERFGVNNGLFRALNLEHWVAEVDRDIKKYTYSQDKKNLLLKEEDQRKTISYKYYKKSNLLEKKFIKDEDNIKIRHFYKYDNYDKLCEEIVDDGISEDSENLKKVTERRIKRFKNSDDHPELVLSTREYYLDLDSGNEILLKHAENTYTKEGWLAVQTHYDANDHLCYTLRWDYDAMGKVICETDPLGNQIRRRFDLNGNLVYEEDNSPGNYREYTYDLSNRLIKSLAHDQDGDHIVRYNYDLKGQKTSSTDMYGNTTDYIYDPYGRIIETRLPEVEDENGELKRPVLFTRYNELNQPVEIIDPLGNSTDSTYTLRGQPTLVNFPDGSFVMNIYSTDGLLTHKIDKDRTCTKFEYDYLGRIIKESRYDEEEVYQSSIKRTYNAFHLIKEEDEQGLTTTYKYDGAGREIETLIGNSRTVKEYNPLGQCNCIKRYYTETDYISDTFAFDAMGHVISETKSDSQGHLQAEINYAYDLYGNKTEITTRNGNGFSTTKNFYNARNQLVQAIDPHGNSTVKTYKFDHRDDHGKTVGCTHTTAPNGIVTEQIEDPLGRIKLIQKRNLNNEIISRTQHFYDLSGNLCKVIETAISKGNPDKEIVTYMRYDSMKHLIETVEGYESPKQRRTRYFYNDRGQLETTIKPDGYWINNEYDKLGRITLIECAGQKICYLYKYSKDGLLEEVLDDYSKKSTRKIYDENRRLKEEILANDLSIKYAYDRLGRPTKVVYPDQTSTDYKYQGTELASVERSGQKKYIHNYIWAFGQAHTLKLPLAAGEINYTFGPTGDVLKIDHSHWKQTIAAEKYQHGDLLGHIIEDHLGVVSSDFEYDPLHQLIGEDGVETHSYLYDSLNNMREVDGDVRECSSLNQVLRTEGTSFTYDLNGNRVLRTAIGGETTYKYDGWDRLKTVEKGNIAWQYTYDDLNRRLSMEVYVNNKLQSKERYIYVGQNEVGAVDETGKITQLRILGVGKGAEIGCSVAFEINDQVFIPIHDQNGNVATLIDEFGSTHETYRYSAFGKEQIYDTEGDLQTVSINPWRFSSKRTDATGLVYFGRRYYDPSIAVWLTSDPLGREAGPNRYAYCMNAPVNHIDLYGLYCIPHSQPYCGTSFGPSFLNMAQTVGNALLGFVPYTAGICETLAKNALPYLVQDVVTPIFHLLSNGTLRDFVPSFREMHSTFGRFVGWHCADHVIIFIPGQNMSYEDTIKYAAEISQSHGGVEVHFVYNASHGFVTDTGESMTLKMGIETNAVTAGLELFQSIDKEFGADVKKTIYTHSQGGQILNSMTKHFSDSYMGTMNVVTLASAKMIPKGAFNDVVNFVNVTDPVPFIADAIGMIRNCFTHETSIKYVSPKDSSFWQHTLERPAYMDKIYDSGKDYVKSFASSII